MSDYHHIVPIKNEPVFSEAELNLKPSGSSYDYNKPKETILGRFKKSKKPGFILVLLSVAIAVSIIGLVLHIRICCTSLDSKRAYPFFSDEFTLPRENIYKRSSNSFEHIHHFGAYSGHFTDDYSFPGIDKLAGKLPRRFPDTCSLEQVHTLHRHAERHPTARVGVNLIKFSKKLKEAVNVSRYLGELEWLKSWNYTLDTEHLMPKGFQTQFESGRTYWENYGKLIYKANKYSCPKEGFNIGNSKNRAKVNIPVIRATDQERIRASAEAWASGFFGEGSDFASNDDVSDCYTMVLQSESVGTNNTLSCGYSCPNFHNYKYYPGRVKNAEWVDIYLTDAVLRLQNHLPEFKNLTNGDVYHMQNLCAFETAFYGSSKFCGLFTDEEWAGYEYAADLIFYHGYSFGSRFGQARGAGWVTEFLARLEKEHINIPKNGVNITLTSNEKTFPINQQFYLDMSHDIDIVSVLATMRFDFLKSAFPSSHMDPTRQFVSSRLVPFGSRLNFEVLQCETGKYIRAKINDRVLPLASLGDCGENRQGLCEYEKFIRGLQDCLDIANFDNVCYGDMLSHINNTMA